MTFGEGPLLWQKPPVVVPSEPSRLQSAVVSSVVAFSVAGDFTV